MDQIALQKYQLKRERTKEPLINQLRQWGDVCIYQKVDGQKRAKIFLKRFWRFYVYQKVEGQKCTFTFFVLSLKFYVY